MHCTIGDVRDKVHRGELQFRFFRDEVIAALRPYRPWGARSRRRSRQPGATVKGEIDYDRWYLRRASGHGFAVNSPSWSTPTSRASGPGTRDGILPAHRRPGGRKFTFLRHEIFQWLISNRYEPGAHHSPTDPDESVP